MESAIRIALIVLALGTLWPMWLTLQRIIYGRGRWLRIILTVMYSAMMIAIGLALPLMLSWGQSVGRLELLADLVLFGIMPIATVALASYVIDHVFDWSQGLLLTTAGCFAVAVLPIGYVIGEQRLLDVFQVTLEGKNTDDQPLDVRATSERLDEGQAEANMGNQEPGPDGERLGTVEGVERGSRGNADEGRGSTRAR